MNQKNKYKLILLLFTSVFMLIILLQFRIHTFMIIVDTCDDDFEIIEKCGCCPEEGDYSYFSECDLDNNLEIWYEE